MFGIISPNPGDVVFKDGKWKQISIFDILANR